MPTAPYNRAPGSLADLLAMQQNAVESPVGPPVASQAPALQMQGQLTPQEQSSLLDILTNPPQTTAPQDEEPQWGKKLASSFADAFNNIATIYAGGPDLRSNYLQSYLNSVERKNAERKQRAEAQGEKDIRGRQDKAKYLLGKSDDAAAAQLKRLQDAADKADERSYKEKVAAQEAATGLSNAMALKTMEETAQTQRNRDDNATRLQIERIQERQKVANEGDKGKQKILDEQHGLYLTAKQQIMGNKARWIQDLKNGRDPADVRAEWQDFLDAGDLLPEYRTSVQAFFDAKIEPLLEEVDRHKAAATLGNQGPTQEQMISPQQIQNSRQSTRQGQRY